MRLTRTDKQKAKDSALDDIIKKEQEEEKVDAFDFAEAVDILSKFNGEWLDKLAEMKKWNEKKEMLDELYNAANTPKIKPGNFADLTKALIKLMSDSNFAVQIAAVKACGPLAKGVRKDFEASAKELVPSLIQKFKEKKAGFAEEILSVFDSF
jgi:cytoskeleton-associated protein 5